MRLFTVKGLHFRQGPPGEVTPPTYTYATWNPSDKGTNCTLTNGNLTATGVSTNGSVRSTISVSSGKWYWELRSPANSGGPRVPIVGVAKSTASLGNYPGSDANGWSYYGFTQKKINASVQTAYGTGWVSTDVISVLLDLDNGTLEFWRNGVSLGVAFTGLTGVFYAMTGGDTGSIQSQCTANFGASAFTYTVPAGYNAGLFTTS